METSVSRHDTERTSEAFNYTPEEYPEGLTLHWCLPGRNHDERTFETEESDMKIHYIYLNYLKEPLLPHTTRERYSSITAARASRRIKQGHASECPFCTDKSFDRCNTQFGYSDKFSGLEAEVLRDFKFNVVNNCRPERPKFPADVDFAELVKSRGTPTLEIVTNTDSLMYAYPEVSLPNWFDLAHAIAQNPWIQVEELVEFETERTRVVLTAKRPDPDNYGRDYFRLLSQDTPYENKTRTE